MKKYKSDILRSVHTDAEGLYKVGLLSAKEMHEYDVGCLVPSRVPNRETSYSSGASQPSAPIPAVAAARA
jgi:DNA-binding transcriptional regulator YiaG